MTIFGFNYTNVTQDNYKSTNRHPHITKQNKQRGKRSIIKPDLANIEIKINQSFSLDVAYGRNKVTHKHRPEGITAGRIKMSNNWSVDSNFLTKPMCVAVETFKMYF